MRVSRLDDDEIHTQAAIVECLESKIEEVAKKTSTKPKALYRLFDAELKFEPHIDAYLTIKSPSSRPASISNGFALVEGDEQLQHGLQQNVISILKHSGQLDYLRQHARDFEREGFSLVVSSDYYRERPATLVNFHKDTLEHTLFVDLSYVNEGEILGPEYILNPPVKPDHMSAVTHSLPEFFISDLKSLYSTLPQPYEISYVTVPPQGIVGFTDELIHHSTPYIGHRGHISIADLKRAADERENDDLLEFAQINSDRNTLVSKDELLTAGFSQAVIKNLFPDMETVGIYERKGGGAGLTNKRSPIFNDNTKLERRLSGDLSKLEFDVDPTANRQFFRLWVQAIPTGI
jgi:hypothetical protein